MGREVRKVPAGWQHPKNTDGRFIPLFDGADYDRSTAEWDRESAKWAEGLQRDYSGGWVAIDPDWQGYPFEQWYGARPRQDEYMPVWGPDEATHYMMYEDTSEGTPISPAFATPEELARWLVDNNASAFASMTADYEHWLRVCRGVPAVCLVATGDVMMPGVMAMSLCDGAGQEGDGK